MATRVQRLFGSAVVVCCTLLAALPVAAQQGWSGIVSDLIVPIAREEAAGPQLVVDSAGNAMAGFSDKGIVRAARFDAATRTWDTPAKGIGNRGFSSGLHIAMDPAGNVVAVWAEGVLVMAARYSAATAAWSAPVALSSHDPVGVALVVDGSGNATVTWATSPFAGSRLQAARYRASSDTWTTVDLASSVQSNFQRVAKLGLDAAGNVTAVWIRWSIGSAVVQSARYTAGAETWGPIVDISEPGSSIELGSVAVDPAGNATALWFSPGNIQAARYDAGNGSWSNPVVVSPLGGGFELALVGLSTPSGAVVATWHKNGLQASVFDAGTSMWGPVTTLAAAVDASFLHIDAAGNAMVAWRGPDVRASRWSAATGAWSDPVLLEGSVSGMSTGAKSGGIGLASDPAGNAIALWNRIPLGRTVGDLRAARWSASAGEWSAPIILGEGDAFSSGFDHAGNAIVAWGRYCYGNPCDPSATPFSIRATEWRAAPKAPGIAGVTAADRALAVAVAAPPTSEARFAVINYEYSIDDGATWTSRSPASTMSPLAIDGLTSGVTYAVRLRGVNGAGPGLASAAAASTPGPAPGPPTGLSAIVAGGMVALEWTAPVNSVPASSYVVEGGLAPGAVGASLPTGSAHTQFAFAAPPVAFYVRVHALGAQRSGPSNEIRVSVTEPGPPTNLTATVTDNVVTLKWTAPRHSIAPTQYRIEAGFSPGHVAVTLLTTDAAPQFTVAAPYGTYYVRVRALSGPALGAASDEVLVPVLMAAPPAPQNLLGLVNGASLVLSWHNPSGGGPTSGLVLHVSGPIRTTLTLPVSESFTFAGVPLPGEYAFFLTAVNATTSSSTRSNIVILTFPGPCSGAPHTPGTLGAGVNGNVVTLTWSALTSGPAVTGYRVLVTGDHIAEIPTIERTLAGAAPPGVYTLSVVATNPCGSSPPTPAQTVVVP